MLPEHGRYHLLHLGRTEQLPGVSVHGRKAAVAWTDRLGRLHLGAFHRRCRHGLRRRHRHAAGSALPLLRSRQFRFRYPPRLHRQLDLPAARFRHERLAGTRARRMADQRTAAVADRDCLLRRSCTIRPSIPVRAAVRTAIASGNSLKCQTINHWFDQTAFTTPAQFTFTATPDAIFCSGRGARTWMRRCSRTSVRWSD